MGGINLYTDKDDFIQPLNQNSNNPVNAIAERADGKILLSTQSGLLVLNTETLEFERSRSGEPFTSTMLLVSDKEKQIWASPDNKGSIYKLNDDLEIAQSLTLDNTSKINSLTCDHNGQINIASNTGLYLLNPFSGSITTLPNTISRFINGSNTLFAAETEDSTLLVGIENQGVFLYNLTQNDFSQLVKPQEFPLLNKYHFLVDSHKNVWLSTNRNGFLFFSSKESQFNPNRILNEAIADQTVGRIMKDSSENIWFALFNSGFLFYNPKTSSTKRFDNQNLTPFLGKNISIQQAYIDSKNRLWAIINNSLVQYDIQEDRLSLNSITSDTEQIYYFAEDNSGNMWFITRNNIYYLDEKGATHTIRTPSHIFFMNCFFTQNDKTYLMSYNEGIFQLGRDGQFVPLTTDKQILNKLQNAAYMYEDHENIIWIGTASSGIVRYNPDTELFSFYGQPQGLIDNGIMAIQEDNNNDLWISTLEGLSKLDKDENIFINYLEKEERGNSPYYFRSIYKTPDGIMYFGRHNGITYFDPQRIRTDNQIIPLRVEGILVNNKVVDLHNPKSPFQSYIGNLSGITLKHNQNMLSIYFSAIDYDAAERLNYAYLIDGFDSNWNYVGNYRRANVHLPPGKYTFKLKVQNTDGQWSTNPLELAIRIKPAPWLSTPAIFFYAIVIVAFIFLSFRTILRRRISKERIALYVKEREMKEEMSEMKINFFTNISHEFRTPLTLIHGPLSELAKDKGLGLYARELVLTMERSVNKMLRLTKQLLDYNKLDLNTVLKLTVSRQDIVLLTDSIVTGFRFIANEKKINLQLIQPDLLWAYIDEDKYGKVLSNILSNALKYTPPHGSVNIFVDTITEEIARSQYSLAGNFSTDYIRIQVIDTGIGISEEQMPGLFERYQRLSLEEKIPDIEGFGIGLHYSKNLIELHKGAIKAERKEKGGMIFSFLLPLNEDIYNNEEKVSDIDRDIITSYSTTGLPQQDKPNEEQILIAEDDMELRDYLHHFLNSHYHVVSVKNGKDAIEILKEVTPDIIVSDIVMPEMDGYELCRMVKNSPDYCHLPVILLTAKTALANQIEGLETGADAYINKPFDPAYLLAAIANLIANRKRMQSLLQHITQIEEESTESSTFKELPMNAYDKKLMNKLYTLMEEQMSAPELNINYIIKEVGMSRTAFYMKIKSITGQNPILFLNTYRLNRAAELIRKKEYSLNDIAVMTGFNSQSSFSRSFKKQFGVSPRDYLK